MTENEPYHKQPLRFIRIDPRLVGVQDAHNANRCPCSLLSFSLDPAD